MLYKYLASERDLGPDTVTRLARVLPDVPEAIWLAAMSVHIDVRPEAGA